MSSGGGSFWMKVVRSTRCFTECHKRLCSYTQENYKMHLFCETVVVEFNLWTKIYLSSRAYTVWPLALSLVDFCPQPSLARLPPRSLHRPCFCSSHQRPALIVTTVLHLTYPLSGVSWPSLSWNVFFSWFVWAHISWFSTYHSCCFFCLLWHLPFHPPELLKVKGPRTCRDFIHFLTHSSAGPLALCMPCMFSSWGVCTGSAWNTSLPDTHSVTSSLLWNLKLQLLSEAPWLPYLKAPPLPILTLPSLLFFIKFAPSKILYNPLL